MNNQIDRVIIMERVILMLLGTIIITTKVTILLKTAAKVVIRMIL